MNLKRYIIGAILPLAFTACQNEEMSLGQSQHNPTSGLYTLYGSVNKDTESRAQVVLNNPKVAEEEFIWNAGDSFTVYESGSDSLPVVFTIAKDYSDDNPSSAAYFTSTTKLKSDKFYGAIYPNRHEKQSDGRVKLELTTSIENGSTEGWKKYFSENMFMKATFTAEEDSASLTFYQLSTLARITYTNATADTQNVYSLELYAPGVAFNKGVFPATVTGDSPSVGSGNEPGEMPSNKIEFLEPVAVPAGESYDFYLIFFSMSRTEYEGQYQGIKFKVGSYPSSGSSVSMETPEIDASLVLGTDNDYTWVVGGRYWFNITQDDDALTWTNGLESSYLVKRLEFLEALEARNPGISFVRNEYGYVDVEENRHTFESIVSLDLSPVDGDTLTLSHTDGLKYFTNLTSLNLNHVQSLSKIDLSKNKLLENFSCVGTKISYMDLEHNLKLKTMDCHDSSVSSLHFAQGCQLTTLNASNCNLKNSWSYSSIGYCTSLQELDCSGNTMSTLDVSANTALEILKCGNQKDETVLTLTLNDNQKSLWESTWSTYVENSNNVTLAE